MPQPVISVERLSKAYRLGHREEVPDTIVGAAKNILTAPWRNFRSLRNLNTNTSHSPLAPSHSEDTLWALKDVSFEINQGDVVGIIGRNGAGKSTLLKILSRITEPTSGRAVIRGRISSLLEVGTGFHPELSGRDNIYMNGTILGMTKREIDRKFDEIVDFSGVEKFLDTPTKRYSSGMQVRLAFAVAAHLEPEILVIDEVLAVGDAEFQRKCMGKMRDVASTGRTVLFVSHNIPAIRTLTDRCAFLKAGQLISVSKTDSAIDQYRNDCEREATQADRSLDCFRREVPDNAPVRFSAIEIETSAESLSGVRSIESGSCLTFLFCIEAKEATSVVLSFSIVKNCETVVSTLFSPDAGVNFRMRTGINQIRCVISNLSLTPGRYTINAGINRNANAKAYDVILDFPIFDVYMQELRNGSLDWVHRPWGTIIANEIKWTQS